MTRLLLVRHGITEWNAAGRFQGHADIPLSELGLQQAAEAGRRLAEERPQALWCSDLTRARQTAAAIGKACDLEPVMDGRLREVDVGTWAGLDTQTVGAMEPDFWPALREGRDFRRSPSGETATESGERVAAALREHAAALADDSTLVFVGHGLSLRVGALLLMGLDYSYARLLGGLGNCSWIELRAAEGYWRLQAYNRC